MRELGKDTLVNLEELLSGRSVQMEHLHSRDLETFRKDSVNDLSCEAGLNSVRLDNEAGAVGEHSASLGSSREPHAHLG